MGLEWRNWKQIYRTFNFLAHHTAMVTPVFFQSSHLLATDCHGGLIAPEPI
jgi:hypothetical protein